MRQKLSALILTYNEERVIERCLKSLCWADEIVVVDAKSTDDTVKICQRVNSPWASKIRVLERAWTGFKDQRNYSLQAATHDWVLVVDADESCSPELAKKIESLLAHPEKLESLYFKVHRIEFFLGKQITAGCWAPSYQDRFFHKHGVQYVNDIHEYPRFPKAPDVIHEPLLHDPGFNTERFLAKMNKYTSIEAQDRYSEGARTNGFRLFFAFLAMFYKNFVYYRAYKDGMHGFVISLLEGVSRVVRHVKIWEETQRQNSNRQG